MEHLSGPPQWVGIFVVRSASVPEPVPVVTKSGKTDDAGGGGVLEPSSPLWRPALMTEPPRKHDTMSGASAGMFLLSAVLLCALLGTAAGALFGATLAGGIVGTMIGFAVGIALVIVRYRDL